MKKLLLGLIVFFAFAPLQAAPVGNTSFPEILQKGFFTSCDSWVDLRVGYEGDFVSDGRMRQYAEGVGRVDLYEGWTNSGTFTLNILDRLDLYGVLGASKTEANWRFENGVDETIHRIKLKTETNFLWAVGGRAILYEWCHTSFGAGGRYTACNYNPNECTSDGVAIDAADAHLHWREWQCNFDISYEISLFTPYVGVKYSHARSLLSNFPISISADLTGSNSFKNRVPVGFYLGCTLSTGRYFMFNIEGRLVDEEAISVFADFRF